MKKKTLLILVIILMFSFVMPLGITAYAISNDTVVNSEATISMEKGWGKAGNTVDLNVSIKNNPDILGASLQISWATGLTLIGDCSGEAFGYLTYVNPSFYDATGTNFIWYANSVDEVIDGTILTLTFQVSDTVKNNDILAVSVSYNEGEIVDKNDSDVFLNVENGYIQIIDYTPGDVTGDSAINIRDLVRLSQYISDGCKTNPNGYNAEVVEDACDVNGDGNITIRDLVRLSQYISDGCITNPNGYNAVLECGKVTSCAHTNLQKVDSKAESCTEDGNIAYWHCVDCNKYYSDINATVEVSLSETIIPATGHTFSDEWSKDDTYHWHVSTCEHENEVSGKSEHSWGEEEVVLEPTIYDEGTMKFTCSICGTIKEESIPVLTSYQVSIYDGENSIDTHTVEKGKDLEIEVPQKEGYRFDHWSIECEYDENKQIYIFKNISCDTEIKAIFVKTCIVEFVDYNGSLLDLKVVDYEAKAETTVIPEREGYRFIGWDKQTIKVTEDMVVKATYIKQYSVTFIYGNNKTKTLMVDVNASFADISQKDIPNEEECFLSGYEFNGWDNEFENIISSQVVNAKYSLKKHLVKFFMPDGITQLGESQYIPHGECAEEPIANEYYYDKENDKVFSFTKWDKDFSAIEEDNVIIKAIYEDEYALPAIIIDYITNGDDTTVEISTYAPLIENYPNTRIYSIEFSFDYKTSSDQNNINITNINVNLNATWLYTIVNNENKNLYNDEINNKTKLYNFAWSSTGGVAIGNDWFIKILCGKYGSGITINKDTFRLNSFSMYVGDSEGESLQKISPVIIYR